VGGRDQLAIAGALFIKNLCQPDCFFRVTGDVFDPTFSYDGYEFVFSWSQLQPLTGTRLVPVLSKAAWYEDSTKEWNGDRDRYTDARGWWMHQ
jgi:hypothetical protein